MTLSKNYVTVVGSTGTDYVYVYTNTGVEYWGGGRAARTPGRQPRPTLP